MNMHRAKTIFLAAALAGTAVWLTGCEHNRPQFTPIDEALKEAQQRQVIDTPILLARPEKPAAGSLWRPGSKQFFKDSRARDIGDLVTVIISESAKAETEANTESSRAHDSTSGLSNLLNLEGKLISRGITPGELINTDSNRTFTGEAKTDREDTVEARIAAIVTQVLPNGYLVIQGKREVVVNYELQQLMLQGIVRPEDIGADNTVPSAKVAEARIFYAGRGTVDEAQTPQYGVRFLDKVMPF
jgi:flagellar L-ring protein precursor FlgH